MNQSRPYLSFIVPTFNEEDNVKLLFNEIVSVCQKNNYTYEIIFINDASTDHTLANLQQLSPVTIINFRRNAGQTSAMDAGIKQAQGEIIIMLDADLQNDPADVPKMLAKINEGYDVVSGWRKDRQDPFMKKFVSRGANFMRKILVNDGIQDSGCTLKAYRRECFEHVDLYGEMHRFIPAILKWRGYRIGEVVVNHRSRHSGVTKYNIWRTIRGFVDMVSVWFWRKFFDRPLHLFGGGGLVVIFIGIIAGLGVFYDRYFLGHDLSETALTTFAVFLILFGTQLFVSGLMFDVLIKNYYRVGKETPYYIKEVIKK